LWEFLTVALRAFAMQNTPQTHEWMKSCKWALQR
jgi:hypothetical protein